MHPKCDFDASKKKKPSSQVVHFLFFLGPFQVRFGSDSTFVGQTVDRNRGSTTADY